MLLARLFSYADAHRYRIGANYQQLPVNAPESPGALLQQGRRHADRTPVSDPVYAPNSHGRPGGRRRPLRPGAELVRPTGEIMRSAYVDHAEDDDWGQAGTMVREVLDDAARERLVDNVVGHLLNGVSEPVLERAFEYWRNDRQGHRRTDRVRGPGQVGRAGPEGRGAGQPGARQHAGQGLTGA